MNQRLALLEDKMDRRLSKTESDVAELKDKVDFFVQTKEPPLQEVFYQNKFWDAKSLFGIVVHANGAHENSLIR